MFNISRRRFLETGGPVAALSAMTRTVAAATPSAQADISGLPRVRQELVDPPFVPEHEQPRTSFQWFGGCKRFCIGERLMKRLIYSLLPVLLIGATTPARGGSQDVLDLSVIDLMTERELRESGLTKLSPDEMENLDAWLNRFASVFLTIQQTTEGSASPPSQPTAPRPTPGTDAACYESSIMVPTPFMGNDGEIFRLLDGSLWEVKYEYEYLYEYYPDVVVCPARGTLVIDGKTLNVVRISGDAPRSPAQLGGTEDIIESQIDGEFTGWEGDTIFRLQNGQVWQQASYSYRYRYALNPHVVIYQSSAGHKMRVDGVDDEIAVRRLQ